jgi:hypothetical protein
MPISTINQNGLNAPLTLTAPVLGTPASINLANATNLPKAALPTGSVLQVVQYSTTTQVTTTSTSFVDVTNFTASITPTSSTSKILALINLNGVLHGATTAQAASFRILRGASEIAIAYNFLYMPFNAIDITGSLGMSYLDSPATTSATTYKLQWYSRLGNTVGLSYTSDTSTMILMEIAG